MKPSQRTGTLAIAAAGVLLAVAATRSVEQKPSPPASAAAAGQAVSPMHAADMSKDYPVRPVAFTSVHLDDAFWLPKIETNREVTIPFAFQQCELSGRVDNFIRAATALRGETLTSPTRKPRGIPSTTPTSTR